MTRAAAPRGNRWRLVALAAAAQLSAVLGEHILLVTALPLWAYERAGAGGISLALIAVTVPALLSLPAGGWTARHSTRGVLLGCGLLRLLLTLLIAAVPTLLPGAGLAPPLALAFLISLVDSFFMPALKAALPDWVAPDQLVRANSLLEATDIPGNLIGPPIAVLLYERWGLAGPVTGQAVAYAVSLLLLVAARVPVRERLAGPAARLADQLRETLSIAWRSSLLRGTLIAWTGGMAALGIAEAMVLPFVREALHQPERLFGIYGGLFGLGMALAAGLSMIWEPEWSDSESLAASAAVSTAALALFAWSSLVWLCGAAICLAGAGVLGVHVAATTLLQGEREEGQRAAMLGLAHSIEGAGLLVGLAVSGTLAPHIGARATLQAALLLLVATTALAVSTALKERRQRV